MGHSQHRALSDCYGRSEEGASGCSLMCDSARRSKLEADSQALRKFLQPQTILELE